MARRPGSQTPPGADLGHRRSGTAPVLVAKGLREKKHVKNVDVVFSTHTFLLPVRARSQCSYSLCSRRGLRPGGKSAGRRGVEPAFILQDLMHGQADDHNQPGNRFRNWQRYAARACDQHAFETHLATTAAVPGRATCRCFTVRPTHEAVTIPSAKFTVLLLPPSAPYAAARAPALRLPWSA